MRKSVFRKTSGRKIAVAAVALALIGACAFAGCSSQQPSGSSAAAEGAAPSEEAILSPHAWKDQYPDQYRSYIDGGYATYSFPSAYGKVNTFFSATHFSNLKPETGCMRCHTSEFSSLVEKYGDELLSKDYADIRSEITVGVTCYSCHGSNPGEIAIANEWIVEAAEKGGIDAPVENLLCAQCHSLPDWGTIASSTDPSTWSMLQYGLDADAYWARYEAQGIDNPVVPPEEAEFNSFTGSIMDKAGARCMDCHMEKKTNGDGAEYTGHIFQSVLNNEKLYENCLSCHTNSTVDERKAALEEVKADYAGRLAPAKAAIDELTAMIESAKTSGSASAEGIEAATALLYKATFYLNYGSDWGNGIHNMGNPNTDGCFDKAIAITEEGKAALK